MILRNRYLLLGDCLLAALAASLSFVIRFDGNPDWPNRYSLHLLVYTLIAIVIKPAIFHRFGLYAQAWEYAGRREARLIVFAVLLAQLLIAGLVLSLFFTGGVIDRVLGSSDVSSFPRAVILIDGLLTFNLVGGLRVAARAFSRSVSSERALQLRQPTRSTRRLLIVGAGDAGAAMVREIHKNPGLGLLPVAFVDDDRRKQRMYVQGVRVMGTRADIPEIVRAMRIDEVLLAMPTASGKGLREITRIISQSGVPFRTLPGIFELIDGSVSLRELREVRIEDLLRREPVKIDMQEVAAYLAGEPVLVTGAGGSIGSELCRQIATFSPGKLILLGHGEHSIYNISLELARRFPALIQVQVIADVRDRRKLARVMAEHKPHVVFHAAAHKHVPLMESNVDEAILNNVIGTWNVVQASLGAGVKRFVLVSTDKAANPTSVMGVTKRLAEMVVQQAGKQSGQTYMAVRFGNVLGSRGSVVPLFLEQIARGGPVTVTHPEATRYFMTIPEAVQLIIQAGAMGQGGNVFVLDMGEPVRIVELAQDLIRLSGHRNRDGIEIVFTGLRPGEKLREELMTAEEYATMTRHRSIFVTRLNGLHGLNLAGVVKELEHAAGELNARELKRLLQTVVLEYRPDDLDEIVGRLDPVVAVRST